MADRDSAYIFGRVFEMIDALVPESEKREAARKFWKMSREFDFSDDDMHADKALVALGLARKGIDPDYPDDGPTMLYGPVKS